VAEPSAYRERLLPKWWVWVVALSFLATLAIAYGAALGSLAGWTVGIAGGVLVVWLLWITAPVISVDAHTLSVAGARLPATAIATVRVVPGEELRQLRGPAGDARLFVALRPWSASDAVFVEIDDADDPHPAWLFTSKHPARAVEAITATM
jgi:hypothetical protein